MIGHGNYKIIFKRYYGELIFSQTVLISNRLNINNHICNICKQKLATVLGASGLSASIANRFFHSTSVMVSNPTVPASILERNF